MESVTITISELDSMQKNKDEFIKLADFMLEHEDLAVLFGNTLQERSLVYLQTAINPRSAGK